MAISSFSRATPEVRCPANSGYHGFDAAAPEPVRAPIPYNTPNQTVRVNDTQRPALAPPQMTKLGHLVLADFDRSARWYMHMLGFIPSDVMCLGDGTTVGSFMRLDRGDEPSDHHTLFVATGLELKVDHVAFEVVDLDAVEMGQADPDGEALPPRLLFDVAQPPGYHVFDRAACASSSTRSRAGDTQRP